MTNVVQVPGRFGIGKGEPLVWICGPCVIEDKGATLEIAARLKDIADRLGVPMVFKASIDKANRTSRTSYRGLGWTKGLGVLESVSLATCLPTTTDIHEPEQAADVSEIVSIIQIPAILCRQTDLLEAAAEAAIGHDCIVNIKKGQFCAAEAMDHAVRKIEASGLWHNTILTERGNCFGYGDLVADMRNIPRLQKIAPTIFDAGHSVQSMGGLGNRSGGQREMIPVLAMAAVAAGADGIFVEVHPNPDAALSDGPNSLHLDDLESLIVRCTKIREAIGA